VDCECLRNQKYLLVCIDENQMKHTVIGLVDIITTVMHTIEILSPYYAALCDSPLQFCQL